MSRRAKAYDEVGYLLLRQSAHLGDELRELDQVGIEDPGGMVRNIHAGAAVVGACLIDARFNRIAICSAHKASATY